MNLNADDLINPPESASLPDAEPSTPSEAPAEEAVTKPARKRRATKTAAPSDAGDSAPDLAEVEAAPHALDDAGVQNADGPRAPRRRRRPLAIEAVAEGDAGAGHDDATGGSDGSTDEPATDVAATESTTAPPAAGAEAVGHPATPTTPPQDINALFAELLSGSFDVVVETPAEPATVVEKRVLAAEPEAPKLHKVLAQAGVGSRRDMEQMIADGLITVNGQPAHTGQRISFGDRVAVDGKPIKVRIQPLPARLIAYHKPAGEVVTHDDPQQRPTVFRRLPRLQHGKWQSVGRLDLNTEGLLLFTNSGQLANQLMHPRFGVEREYAVRLLGRVDDESSAKLIAGVELDGQKCALRSIADGGGGGDGANHWYRVVITEGRNREVRRLFEAVGLTVSRLIRIRYGNVVLPRGLKRGVWVDLTDADLRAVRQLVSAHTPRGEAGGERPVEARGAQRPPQQGRDGRQNGRQEQRPPQQRDDRGPGRNGPRAGRNGGETAPYPVHAADGPSNAAEPFDPDFEEEIDHSRIPNPLEQTFDKRFVQNPRSPAGGRGFGQGGGGFGQGGSAPHGGPRNSGGAPKKPGAPREPDPMQTSVGYIGGDAFHRKGGRSGGGGGGGGGGQNGGNRGGNRGGNFGGGFRGR